VKGELACAASRAGDGVLEVLDTEVVLGVELIVVSADESQVVDAVAATA
jgi:hypothetical protein